MFIELLENWNTRVSAHSRVVIAPKCAVNAHKRVTIKHKKFNIDSIDAQIDEQGGALFHLVTRAIMMG